NLELLRSAMHKHHLFDDISPDLMQGMVVLMWKANIPSGHKIISQGEAGDRFYVVEQGSFQVRRYDPGFSNGEVETIVATCPKGTIFGVSSLMNRSPRNASVVAAEDSVVWVVTRNAY